MSKLTIITGAAGFIGSALVAHLNEGGKTSLLLVDDLKLEDKWKNLVGKSFVDLISKKNLLSFLEKNSSEIDAIVHLGACSNTLEKDADYLLENNFRYTKNLCLLALREKKRFIYASSAATYGDGSLGFSDEKIEDLKPINMYGYSKHLFDLFAKRENLLSKIVGLKYFNVFGPNEYHKAIMSSMVFKMMKKVQNGEKITLFKSNDPKYKDGEQKRDFIYVKDAVKMTALFLDELKKENGIFNIGTGNAVTWNRLAKALFKALGKDPDIEYIEMPKELSRQYQNYTCAEMQKFKKIYPSLKTLSIEESVEDYVQNYLLKDKTW